MRPQLPIDVDDETGVWSTDGLPMLYVPRHFFVNNHTAIEAELGQEAYAGVLYDAGYRSAYYWCETEGARHGLKGIDVFVHYLKRLSQRGWGLFSFVAHDVPAGTAEIKLEHSLFVLGRPGHRGKLCYMFAGWFAGAMDFVRADLGHGGRSTCVEACCAAEGFGDCLFSVRPQSTPLSE